VTATDSGGASGTAEVVITVGGPPANQPPQGSPPGDGAEPPASGPRVRGPKSLKVRTAIKRGVRLRVSCVEACRAKSVLRLSGERVGVSKWVRIKAGGTRTVVIRLERSVRRNLLAAMRQADVRRLKATAITTISTADGSRAFPVRITLKR
jgi:hypothetical protein